MALSPLMDGSKQKNERRRTTYKLVRRHRPTSILATNFPEEQGRKFVHKLAGLGVPITLVEKQNFSVACRKELASVTTLVPYTDIFYQMLSNVYDFIDIDLCNGLAYEDVRNIEACTSWKVIHLTVWDKYRSKFNKQAAAPKGVNIQQYIFELCERNGWGCQLSFAPAPYKRGTKNDDPIRGIMDGRGPKYFTFIITRK